MKTSIKVCLLSLLAVYGASNLIACTYEAPQASQTGGAGGNDTTSSSGQGGSSGQSGSGPCESGQTKVCVPYSGPQGTESVGACAASTSECLTSETWDVCSDEVIPTLETCTSTTDVNCDDIAPCMGSPLKSYPFVEAQSLNSDFILAMATGAGSMGRDGSVYAVGGLDGSSSDPPNNLRVLAWHRDQEGVLHDWSSKFVFAQPQIYNGAVATGVTVNANTGDVYIAGTYVGCALSIGGQQLPNSISPQSFLAHFSASGTLVNARLIHMGGSVSIHAMTSDAGGNIFVAGSYQGMPTIDGMPFPLAAESKGFVIKYGTNGKSIWRLPFAGVGVHEVKSITTMDNDIVIATEFVGQLAVNLANGMSQVVEGGLTPDILVSRLRSSDGFTQWYTPMKGDGVGAELNVGGLAATSTGVLVGGRFTKDVVIGETKYTNGESDNTADAFLAYLEPVNGEITDHQVINGPGVQDIRGITVDSASDFIATGLYSNTFKLPPKDLTNSDAIDAVVFKIGPNLDAKWIERFRGANGQAGQAVVVGKTIGNIFVGGAFETELLGISPEVKAKGSSDAFLLEMSN